MSIRIVAWVIPTPFRGSGGFRTIFNKAKYLETIGVYSDFYILSLDTDRLLNTADMADCISQWFGYSPHKVGVASSPLDPKYYAVIATAWNTARYVARQKHERKFYFVQDYETLFYPADCFAFSADDSYRYGLQTITMGRWLAKKMRQMGSPVAGFIEFTTDNSHYFPRANMRKEYAICGIYQPEKNRRLSSFLLEAAELLLESDSRLTIYLYGSEPRQQFPVPLNPRLINLGLLSLAECNNLYNKCLIGVSLSATNPSRIPFEMISSGIPVIELNLENNHFDYPEEGVFFAEPSPAGIASAISALLSTPKRLASAGKLAATAMSERNAGRTEDQIFADILMGNQESSLPPILPVKASSVGIDPSFARSYDRLCERREIAADLARTPLIGTMFLLSVKGIRLKSSSTLKVAIWSKADQSDMVWCTFRTGLLSGYKAKFEPEVGSNGATVFHFHFYEFPSDANPIFKCSFDQALAIEDKPFRPGETRNFISGTFCCEVKS